jgi:hypothetical protein
MPHIGIFLELSGLSGIVFVLLIIDFYPSNSLPPPLPGITGRGSDTTAAGRQYDIPEKLSRTSNTFPFHSSPTALSSLCAHPFQNFRTTKLEIPKKLSYVYK